MPDIDVVARNLIFDLKLIATLGGVCPEQFGAVGDGINDDTNAVQAAINTGKPVLLSARTYLIINTTMPGSTGLSLLSGTQIIGISPNSVLKYRGSEFAFFAYGQSNILLQNFTLDGTGTVNTYAVYVDWIQNAGSNVIVDNLTITNFGIGGVTVLAAVGTPSSNVTVKNCFIKGMGASAIAVQQYISSVLIINNYIQYWGLLFADQIGIVAGRAGNNIVVANNIVLGSPSALGSSVHGISLDTGTDVTCSSNVCRDTIGYGIEAGFITNGIIDSNVIQNCKAAGIGISGIQGISKNINVSITGNTINGGTGGASIFAFMTGGDGTYFHENIVISSNTVDNAPGLGMYLNLIDQLVVNGNSIRNSTLTGLYVDNCINGIVDGNSICKNNTSSTAGYGGSHLAHSLIGGLDVIYGSNQVEHNNVADTY